MAEPDFEVMEGAFFCFACPASQNKGGGEAGPSPRSATGQ